MRKLYDALVMASKYHARWEIETSTRIIQDKRRLFVLLALCIPVFLLPAVVQAADLPAILGGKSAYSPAFATTKMFAVSIIVGLCAGLITGCIGAGGGFIITPALMSVGVKGILAVGTDQFHIFAKAIMGTTVHKKLGNVSVSLAVAFVAGSLIGATGGGVINRTLYAKNPVLSDTFITLVYIFLLGILGLYAIVDFFKWRKSSSKDAGVHAEAKAAHSETAAAGTAGLTSIAVKLQSVKIPPIIAFDHDVTPGGRRISAFMVAICGAIVGFVAAIMGVGGGFLTFPLFVYVLGVSSFTTVGTDILQIIFTAGYSSIAQYAIYGFVFYTLAMGMLIGSLVGIQIGALTTKVVKGIYIRGFYAVTIIAAFINMAFSLPGKLTKLGVLHLSKSVISTFDLASIVLFFIVIGIFAFWVLSKFFTNLSYMREEV